MKISKGTYLQGVIEAEELINNLLEIDSNIRSVLQRMITRNETPDYFLMDKILVMAGMTTYIIFLTMKN